MDDDKIELYLNNNEEPSALLLEKMGDGDKDAGSDDPTSALVPNVTVTLQRKLYTQDVLDSHYTDRSVSPSVKDRLRDACSCSLTRVLQIILGYLPVVGVVRNYAWRADTVSDFIAGLSISFMHMPQGLALGLLASVPAVIGLYSSFFPVLIYLVFGTCRHVSMGTNAVLSLLTAGIVERELGFHMATVLESRTTMQAGMVSTDQGIGTTVPDSTMVPGLTVEEQNAYKVGVASSLALLSGIMLLAMGLLRLGFINSYLSTSFVGGFTTAAAFHITTSQIPKMLGIKIPTHSGAGKIVKIYIDVFKNIHESNPADVIVSIISLIFLLGVTILVNERYRAKLRVPIPVDLVIVVVSTIISYLAHLEQRFGLAVVGDIPLGLPSPSLPDVEVFGRVLVDSFVVAILIFTLTIALAKLMAGMHNYPIEPDQELVAYGVCNLFSSFFQCVPVGTAPPRTMILSNINTRSTLNGIVTAAFILLILLAAGQLFTSLPVAVLATMICVAVKNLLLQVKGLPSLWRVSKPDFLIWVVTCLASIFIDLDIGIAVGVGVSVFSVIVKNQLVSGDIGGLSVKEDLVLYGKHRDGVKEGKQFRIFYFPSQLYFANVDRFSSELYAKVLNPMYSDSTTEVHLAKKDGLQLDDATKSEHCDGHGDDVRYVILECSAMTYIDIAGANTMKKVSSQYQRVGVTLLLARCPKYTLNLLDRAGYFEKMDRNTVFCDVYDAVTCILNDSV